MVNVKLSYTGTNFSGEEINNSISEILRENALLSLASVSPDGTSWINTAFFSFNAKLELFFLTETDAQHSKNTQLHPSVAITIFDSHQKWGPGKLKGAQIFGTCQKAQGTTLAEGILLYVQRFPDVKKWMMTPKDLLEGLMGSWVYVIQPRRLKILDETRFGEENYVTVEIAG